MQVKKRNSLGYKVNLGLVQINNSFSQQNYLPYSIGLLQAYALQKLKGKENFNFLNPIYKRDAIQDVQKQLAQADIVFFSVYVWNMMISLEIAKRIKKNNPETLIVFGGPQVPNNSEEFLRKYPFIDIICHGEGEKTFLSILEHYAGSGWKNVPSISYIDEDGYFVKTLKASRISHLDEIPSPYVMSAFKSLMQDNPKEEWVALWETNRGCPFLCSYCVWGDKTQNRIYSYSLERLYREIDWFSQNKIEFVFCCDANFGILPRDIEIVKYFARNKEKYSYPKYLSIQNTKNSTARLFDMYKIMSQAKMNKGISLSLQSVNIETLKNIRRDNISRDAFQKLQSDFNSENIETFTDIILGLPSETYETFANGVSSIIENGQHNRIQFNNLVILVNSEMDKPEYQKKYGFDIVKTKTINIHGSLFDKQEVQENQRLVVGTKTMPRKDWRKARVFSWIAALLYFDKLLQISLILLNKMNLISFRELIEVFSNGKSKSKVLCEIHEFFMDKARDIQKGGSEYCASKKWLNIWWPADELMLIRLCEENKLKDFYKEAELELKYFLKKRKLYFPDKLLHEAIYLNQSLLKLPFKKTDFFVCTSYNILELYQAALSGESIQLERGEHCYHIDRKKNTWSSWNDWCRKVIWYENKKGAYLYSCQKVKGVTSNDRRKNS